MNDSWIGPLGAVLLVGCCLLLETGLIGGGLATGLAAVGYSTTGFVVGGATLAVLVVAWTYHRRRAGLRSRIRKPQKFFSSGI